MLRSDRLIRAAGMLAATGATALASGLLVASPASAIVPAGPQVLACGTGYGAASWHFSGETSPIVGGATRGAGQLLGNLWRLTVQSRKLNTPTVREHCTTAAAVLSKNSPLAGQRGGPFTGPDGATCTFAPFGAATGTFDLGRGKCQTAEFNVEFDPFLGHSSGKGCGRHSGAQWIIGFSRGREIRSRSWTTATYRGARCADARVLARRLDDKALISTKRGRVYIVPVTSGLRWFCRVTTPGRPRHQGDGGCALQALPAGESAWVRLGPGVSFVTL